MTCFGHWKAGKDTAPVLRLGLEKSRSFCSTFWKPKHLLREQAQD